MKKSKIDAENLLVSFLMKVTTTEEILKAVADSPKQFYLLSEKLNEDIKMDLIQITTISLLMTRALSIVNEKEKHETNESSSI